MSKIPTQEEMEEIRDMVEDFVENLDDDVEKTKEPAKAIQKGVGMLYTSKSVGIFFHPDKQASAVGPGISGIPSEERRYLLAGLRKSAANLQASPADLDDTAWVKVAYSPVIRRTGELLNFFPGNYPGGLANSPGPLQSMLTSGLVGAGLGYGAGWLGEQLLPEKWKKGRLSKTLAMLGGAGGMTPGLVWGLANRSIGNDFNDPSLLEGGPVPNYKAANDLIELELGQNFSHAINLFVEKWAEGRQNYEKSASAGAFAGELPAMTPKGPLDVNVNSMGQTLWEVGASPQSAAMTMGALHAAQRMPRGRKPGWVSPGQMARLAANMGGGYLSGALVGTALGALTGLPQGAQNTLKRTGAYLGVINTVVPRLFGA